MQADELKKLIETGVAGAEVMVQGDGDHFEATVVSEQFEGKSMVQQHQMVYGVLGDLMQGQVHALALRTLTPQQWKKQIQ
jgi:acid stress-induced BolA-like protein IbaG/YrbA